MRASTSRTLGWAFVVVAGVMFLARGPMRTLGWGADLAPPYAGARAWLFGENPYATASLARVLAEADGETNYEERAAANPSVYPPLSFPVLAPFAVLTWPIALTVFLGFCLVLFAVHLVSLLRLAELGPHDAMSAWLAGAVLALAPYHTGVAVAQVAIPSVLLLVIAIDRIQRGREPAGGVLLGLATLFKPQIAAPFILFYFLRGRTRAATIALAVTLGSAAVGVAWLEINGIPWMQSWRDAMRGIMASGSQHDPSGPWSAQLVELRPLITALTGSSASGAIGFIIAATLGAGVYLAGRRLGERHDLLLLASVGVLTLLAAYHRFYDAALISLALAWAARARARDHGFGREAAGAAICCAVFFIPGAWMLQRLVNDGTIPADWSRSFLWNAIVLRQQNWALAALFVVLALAIAKARRSDQAARA